MKIFRFYKLTYRREGIPDYGQKSETIKTVIAATSPLLAFRYFDEKGTTLLVAAFKACQEHNGKLFICNANIKIDEALEYVFLNSIIKSFKSKEDAITAF